MVPGNMKNMLGIQSLLCSSVWGFFILCPSFFISEQIPAFQMTFTQKMIDLARPAFIGGLIACVCFFTYHNVCVVPFA
jgi:hypothetical protein